jgi:putative hemolysin
MALVTLRESQVRGLADRGIRGRRVAKLVENPNRFLSAVQIGVTLAALGSSAFGEVTLADSATHRLQHAGLAHWLAGVIGFVGVFLVITYLTLVVGELAPKRLALQRAEGVAARVAGFIDRFAGLSRPIIWFLSKSTDAVVRLAGGDPSIGREAISEEELRDLVVGHAALGRDERKLIGEVFDAGDRQLREVMIPRTEVDVLDASMPLTRALRVTAEQPHSRFPVFRGSADDIIGFVHIRDLVTTTATERRGKRVGDVAREIAMFPDTKAVLPALSEMRRSGRHIAIVVDEYGGTAGIVTLEDLIEEVIGDIRDEYDEDVTEARRLAGGEVEVDGKLNLDEIAEIAAVELPEGPYATIAGFVMAELGRLPRTGDAVEYDGVRIAVVRTDGRRVARVRLTPRAAREDAEPR